MPIYPAKKTNLLTETRELFFNSRVIILVSSSSPPSTVDLVVLEPQHPIHHNSIPHGMRFLVHDAASLIIPSTTNQVAINLNNNYIWSIAPRRTASLNGHGLSLLPLCPSCSTCQFAKDSHTLGCTKRRRMSNKGRHAARKNSAERFIT